MKRLLEEPLLHFLLLGAALFAAFSWRSDSFESGSKNIVVTQGRIAHLKGSFARTWQRAPSPQEMDAMIEDYVREEAYVREAIALGLDRDDLIIRRRLQQKMEFVSADTVAPAEPSDAELQTYLQAHAGSFAIEQRFSFRQIYLNPQTHGANLARDAERLRNGLNQAGAKTNMAKLGDTLPLEHEIENASVSEVGKMFGEKFVAALRVLSPGQWQGPVESAYGVHVVYLANRTEGRLPRLEEVRERVRHEWASARQREEAGRFAQTLLQKYAVTIEAPPATAGTPGPLAAR